MSTLLTVRVKPGSRVASIGRADGVLVIAVREPAREDRANEAVRRALATFLEVAPSRIRLVRGATARTKTYAIEGIDAAALAEQLEQ